MKKGLTVEQVEQSRLKHGANILTPPAKEPLWRLFLEKFSDPVIRILLMAAFLSLGIYFVDSEGHIYETLGIFFAIFLATGISFFFEVDASRKFDILNQVNDNTAIKVMRDGNVMEVPKGELVVGDVVVLEQGDEVPADIELFEAIALTVNESCLTGEPSMSKTCDPADFKHDVTYPSNMVLRGTTVIDGHGMGEVVRVGDATEFGKVARQSAEKSQQITPLNRQLDRLAKLIGLVGFSLAVITFLALFIKDVFDGVDDFTLGQIGLMGALFAGAFVALSKIWVPIVWDAFVLAGKPRELPRLVARGSWFVWLGLGVVVFAAIAASGYPFGVDPLLGSSWVSVHAWARVLGYFMVSVTLIVVAVPEGLPMSVTLSLALSMRKMLKANNLVRKMHACETMGATTVICTDKTGTLTKNQMSVFEANFAGADLDVVCRGIAVNTTANLDRHAVPVRPLGNPTEGALLMWMEGGDAGSGNRGGVDYASLREGAEVEMQIPFSTRHKYMATIVQVDSSSDRAGTGRYILYVKGAPEVVIGMCGSMYEGVTRAGVEAKLLEYQNKAMRTLAFACMELSSLPEEFTVETMPTGLQFLGFVAISDPVREDVPAAVERCMAAGIGVKIVTGDTPGTAREIGRQIGLWNDNHDTDVNQITGMEWEALSDEQALDRVMDIKIMSRARPMDKQRLVQMLQRCSQVVAVTGDGTNDAPALNFADVGLSMGSGTSVAKEASDITLLDDSFASIATAVMWGRSVYLNIQRFVLFQLTINVAALSLVFLGSMFGFELPLTVTQMLWVNLIMDTFAAGALASLPPDPRVMGKKPRAMKDFIVSPAMARSIIGVGLAFVVGLMALLGWYQYTTPAGMPIEAQRMSQFFTIFVMLQFWNMFNAKAYMTGRSAFAGLNKCGGFLLVALLIVVGQILIVSFGGDVFRVVPLPVMDWVQIIAGTSVVLWIGEAMRLLKRLR